MKEEELIQAIDWYEGLEPLSTICPSCRSLAPCWECGGPPTEGYLNREGQPLIYARELFQDYQNWSESRTTSTSVARLTTDTGRVDEL